MGYGRERGDRDRQRQRRGGGRGRDRDFEGGGYDSGYEARGGGGDRPQRPPLQWEEVDTLEKGSCRMVIKAAKLQNGGRRLSFSLERVGREDRTSKFFQDRDLADLENLCREAKHWADADRAEHAPPERR